MPSSKKKPLTVIDLLRQMKALREERDRRTKQFVDPGAIDVDATDDHESDKVKEETRLSGQKAQSNESNSINNENPAGSSSRRKKLVPRQRFKANSNGVDHFENDFETGTLMKSLMMKV